MTLGKGAKESTNMAERGVWVWAPVIRESAQGADMARGILRFAQTRPEWQVHVGAAATNRYHARLVRRAPPDGVIGCICSAELLDLVKAIGKPVVDLSSIFLDEPFPRVGVDDGDVGRKAAEYLIGQGLARFAVLGSPSFSYSEARTSAFRRAVEARSLECTSLSEGSEEPTPWITDRRRASLVAGLKSLPKPAGLFATTDTLAQVCLQLCKENGIGVPDEVAVLGVGNDELTCEATRPGISSLRLPGEEIGFRAARTLASMLAGNRPRQRPVLVPCGSVVERTSTDVVYIDDPIVRRAVSLIRQRATDPIGPAQIVAAVPVSRRALERKFRRARGRSLLQEIHQVRLARAMDLLTHTAMPMKAIAFETGFRSACRFNRVFRAATNRTPTAYRKEHQRAPYH